MLLKPALKDDDGLLSVLPLSCTMLLPTTPHTGLPRFLSFAKKHLYTKAGQAWLNPQGLGQRNFKKLLFSHLRYGLKGANLSLHSFQKFLLNNPGITERHPS